MTYYLIVIFLSMAVAMIPNSLFVFTQGEWKLGISCVGFGFICFVIACYLNDGNIITF